jgi:hypothetical protein
MGYFDHFQSGSLNEFKIKLKNRKKLIDVLFYLWIDGYLNFM